MLTLNKCQKIIYFFVFEILQVYIYFLFYDGNTWQLPNYTDELVALRISTASEASSPLVNI